VALFCIRKSFIYINERKSVSFEFKTSLRDVDKDYKGRVMINIGYKPSEITNFKLSHIKKLVKSLFKHEVQGTLDIMPVNKLSWFK